MRGLERISTGKTVQGRGLGHSVNRRTLKTEELLSSSPSQKSALILKASAKSRGNMRGHTGQSDYQFLRSWPPSTGVPRRPRLESVGNPPHLAQRSPRPFGPGTPKESEKSVPGPEAPGSPALSFFSLVFWFLSRKPQNYQGFSVPAEPTRSLEKIEKTPKITKEKKRFTKEI